MVKKEVNAKSKITGDDRVKDSRLARLLLKHAIPERDTWVNNNGDELLTKFDMVSACLSKNLIHIKL